MHLREAHKAMRPRRRCARFPWVVPASLPARKHILIIVSSVWYVQQGRLRVPGQEVMAAVPSSGWWRLALQRPARCAGRMQRLYLLLSFGSQH